MDCITRSQYHTGESHGVALCGREANLVVGHLQHREPALFLHVTVAGGIGSNVDRDLVAFFNLNQPVDMDAAAQ